MVLAFGTTAQATLVAWWPFEEASGSIATDASGSADQHNATLYGTSPAFARPRS